MINLPADLRRGFPIQRKASRFRASRSPWKLLAKHSGHSQQTRDRIIQLVPLSQTYRQVQNRTQPSLVTCFVSKKEKSASVLQHGPTAKRVETKITARPNKSDAKHGRYNFLGVFFFISNFSTEYRGYLQKRFSYPLTTTPLCKTFAARSPRPPFDWLSRAKAETRLPQAH